MRGTHKPNPDPDPCPCRYREGEKSLVAPSILSSTLVGGLMEQPRDVLVGHFTPPMSRQRRVSHAMSQGPSSVWHGTFHEKNKKIQTWWLEFLVSAGVHNTFLEDQQAGSGRTFKRNVADGSDANLYPRLGEDEACRSPIKIHLDFPKLYRHNNTAMCPQVVSVVR